MMRLHHVVQQHFRRISTRFPLLRQLSLTTVILNLIWLYILYWGERTTFAKHISDCAWSGWEQWPGNAAPHHLALIADPQLVDPHTYPGRPWPLSTLTERYTDRYMARNFRLINAELDPDSLVFLGDLLDGGREWAPRTPSRLKHHQREWLENWGVKLPEEKSEEDATSQFSYGENGRWKGWDQRQWDKEYARFSRIFFEQTQLYPKARRETVTLFEQPPDQVVVGNGARNVSSREFATTGTKSRRVITSLPGNHDIGFGAGVQVPVRNRFQIHFGEANRVDVFGNHTFVSIDSPSLSAFSQYVPDGGETLPERAKELRRIWEPATDFLESIRIPAAKAVKEFLADLNPQRHGPSLLPHVVTDMDHEDSDLQPHDEPEPSSAAPTLPVVLLTHVPLYRDPDTDCGPERERGHSISVSAGYQYQNVITQSLSNKVINAASAAGDIAMAFSGDDHDYCDVMHRYNIGQYDEKIGQTSRTSKLRSVREITVKSFSWAMGVRIPGFVLVSLWNPLGANGQPIRTSGTTIQTHLCLLPDQLSIFITYAMLLATTVAVLLIRAVILALRRTDRDSNESPDPPALAFALPHYQSTSGGLMAPNKENSGRHRASSTSMSHQQNGSTSLGVQRSYNARTRSVSPAVSGFGMANIHASSGPLIEKAGFYPNVRWADPKDDSDEESHIGSVDLHEDDTQGKWKRRRRVPNAALRAFREFVTSVLAVGMPAALWYGWLISHG